MNNRRFILSVFFVILSSILSRGQGRDARKNDWGVGGVFSPRGTGAVLSKGANSIRLIADMYGVIDGRFQPGFKFYYFADFPMSLAEKPELRIQSFVSPGIMLGRVRDKKREPGFCGGIALATGVEFIYRKRLSVRCGFSGDFAMHHHHKDGKRGKVLDIYQNGFRYAPFPELTVTYKF